MGARTALGPLVLLVVVALVTLAGCGSDPFAPPSPYPSADLTVPATTTVSPNPRSPSPTPTPIGDQDALDRLLLAARTGDRATWDAGIATVDPGFGARASVLYANVQTLGMGRLRAVLDGPQLTLPAARQARLGGRARAVQARLVWRLPGDEVDASASVWLTLVPGPNGDLLAGTDDGTSLDSSAVPLWWLGPVSRVTRGDVTVVTGTGQSAARWATLATRAARDARDHLPGPLAKRWDGHLVVQVPADETDLARLLGVARDAYATTAAVTRAEGPTTAAALRVVVNPVTADESDDELGATLTHETVHVATRSAESPAPLWAVEGLAEYVALEAHPDQREDDLRPLRTELGRDGLPSRLPRNRAFAAGSAGVEVAYAQSWLACRAIARERSRSDLGRFYLALDDGDSVADAARDELGADESDVVDWWRSSLRNAAAGRGG